MKKFIKSIYQNNSSPFYRRIIAYFIDWYIISFLTLIPINLIYSLTYQKKNFESTLTCLPIFQAFCAFFIGLLLSILYLVYLPYKNNGQTLGKKLLKIRITSINNKSLSLHTLFVRNGFSLLILEGTFFPCSIYFWELMNLITKTRISSVALNIFMLTSIASLFLSLFLSNHRMLHDLISKTYITYTKSNYMK